MGPEPSAFIEEAQTYGDRLIRLTEHSSEPISRNQYEVLIKSPVELERLGLTPRVDLEGTLWLEARDVVGSFRFVEPDTSEWVIVDVAPKIQRLDLFKMIDRAHQGQPLRHEEETELPVGVRSVSGVFVAYFAVRLLAFLRKERFRGYTFSAEAEPSRVRGRPLVEEYLLRRLPRGEAHVLPARRLDFSADVFENQVLAYSAAVALRQEALLQLGGPSSSLRDTLGAALRLLAGVEPRRITPREIRLYRHTRATRRFKPIHDLCRILLENQSIMMDPGDRVTFAAFSLDMPDLFERYVARAFATAFGKSFVGNKNKLQFLTSIEGQPIELDGLIARGARRVVVEAKYRRLPQADDEEVLTHVPETHIYQAVTYCGHAQVRAREAILVYPTWTDDDVAVRLSTVLDDFGWSRGHAGHIRVRALGINLTADFATLAQEIRDSVTPVLEAA